MISGTFDLNWCIALGDTSDFPDVEN